MTHRELLDDLFAAWRSGDALRSVAYFSSDATYHEAHREAVVGRDAIAAHFTRFFRDGPLWRFEVDELLTGTASAAVRYRFAVKTGERWDERSGAAFVRFENGSIAEWREYDA